MLVSILPVPFADAARQRQYEAVLAALHAEAGAPVTVLLGNLAAFTPVEADLLVVRPGGLALLVLTPRAGHLTVPALTYGPWQLSGQPLPGRVGSDNPFAQYQQQVPPVLAWLSEQLDLPEAELPPCLGIALFEAPLTFGPGVEAQLHRHPDAQAFELVGDAAQLPARLHQLPTAGAADLSSEDLLEWSEFLLDEAATPAGQNPVPSLSARLEQKLRRLWGWLGAEDIPADPPYGGPAPDQHLRDQQEQARLRQLRQELQAELHQQRQEAAIREAARTQELALLRQQLAQAGPSATERQAEQQAKAALEESLRAARAELATRNQELDTRIQQLGQLIEQMQTVPVAPSPSEPAPAKQPTAKQLPGLAAAKSNPPTAAAGWSFRRLRQAERWGLVVLAAASVGAGTWGVVRWARPSAPSAAATVAQHHLPDSIAEDTLAAAPSFPDDSLASQQAAAVDTLSHPTAEPTPTATEAEPGTTTSEPAAPEATEPIVATPAPTETTEPAPATSPATTPAPSPEPTAPETSPTP